MACPNSAFSERHVLGDLVVQVMTYHEHIQMLVDGIDGIGRVGLVEDGITLALP